MAAPLLPLQCIVQSSCGEAARRGRWTYVRLVAGTAMVNHGRFVLTEEKKTEMEEGGGTKESTKVIRKAIGANFVQYVADREAMWCGDSSQAPKWWTPPGGLGAPRTVEELATLDNCCLMGYYARDWLWEAQVLLKLDGVDLVIKRPSTN